MIGAEEFEPPEPEPPPKIIISGVPVIASLIATGRRRDRQPWRDRYVTNGRLAVVGLLITLLNGCLTGVVFWFGRASTARDQQALRQQIVVVSTEQHRIETQQQRQADLQIKGLRTIHEDFQNLSRLIISDHGGKPPKPNRRP